MDYQNRVKSVLVLVSVLFLCACAQQVAPTGGPKDEKPPEVVVSMPKNYSTFFKEKRIVIEFDEFISLDKLQDNLIISPVLKNEPDFLVKGKKLVIDIDDTLKENTTYVINFNDAIVDITERNPISGFQYVFSTGDYVDSLSLNGRVVNAFDLSPVSGAYVMLYENMEDSLPYLELPRYITKTKEDGFFTISSIKSADYKIVALEDKNRNYLFDLPKERFAYLDSVISIAADTNQIALSLFMFEEESEKQYLSKFGSRQFGKFNLIYNLPVDTISIVEVKNRLEKREVIKQFRLPEDTLNFWINPPSDVDSLQLVITADEKKDTVNIVIPKKTKSLVQPKVTSNAGAGKLDLNDSLVIKIDRPSNIDASKISLFEDTILIDVDWVTTSSSKMRFSSFVEWKEGTKYRLVLKDSAFTDIYTGTSDSINTVFTTPEISSYGTLKITLNDFSVGDLLQLKLNDKVIKTEVIPQLPATFNFDFLKAGEYGLKVIHDKNGNGKWDTGNYLNHQQPEKVTVYSGTVTIRSNWDQEVEWKVE